MSAPCTHAGRGRTGYARSTTGMLPGSPLQVSGTSNKQAVRQAAHAVAVCFAWRRSQIDFWAAVDFIGTVVFLVDIVLK